MSQKGTFTVGSPKQTASKLAAQHLARIWRSAHASAAAAAEVQSITHKPAASQMPAKDLAKTRAHSCAPRGRRQREVTRSSQASAAPS